MKDTGMTAFAVRNLKLYFRDKEAVFFSILAVLITLGLYVLFLGDVYAENIAESGITITSATEIMDNWVMAGIVAEVSITISYGAVLLRQIMMETVMEDAFSEMSSQVLEGVCESFGVTYYFWEF